VTRRGAGWSFDSSGGLTPDWISKLAAYSWERGEPIASGRVIADNRRHTGPFLTHPAERRNGGWLCG